MSVLYVNHNGGSWITTSIERVLDLYSQLQIIVADNGSTDGSCDEIVRRFPGVKLVRTGWNAGYAGGNNYAAKFSDREFLFIFNPDALLTEGAIEALLEPLTDPTVGAVGPKIYKGWTGGGDQLDSAGGTLEFPLGEGPSLGYLQLDSPCFSQQRDVAYLSGAALMVRRSTFEEFGGFDELLWCYCEESDLCWRMRMNGLRCVYEPAAIVYHKGSVTFGEASATKIFFQTRNRIIMSLQNLEFKNVAYFIIAELIVGLFVQSAAWLTRPQLGRAYTMAWADVISKWTKIVATRRRRQSSRTKSDRVVLRIHSRVGIIASLTRYTIFAVTRRKTLFGPM